MTSEGRRTDKQSFTISNIQGPALSTFPSSPFLQDLSSSVSILDNRKSWWTSNFSVLHRSTHLVEEGNIPWNLDTLSLAATSMDQYLEPHASSRVRRHSGTPFPVQVEFDPRLHCFMWSFLSPNDCNCHEGADQIESAAYEYSKTFLLNMYHVNFPMALLFNLTNVFTNS